ncbi:hypothetical protein EC9_30650 [Rosistilla ulvae]|uniref:Uncharacterized protein n=1 Tax=Rosistilla ulvae TaxID=1930277 RepID=A0A517M1X8_9BACT|nr:hypothetical protein [Rosistilla ulvae]QDS88870.1 hypothetical protein EC9_30650 [Rosistilla ulvae]
MIANPIAQIDISRLRTLVQNTLSELGQLEPGAFPITQRVIAKGGTPCGLYFCLHGPRSVKLTAVCDMKTRAIYFYGTDGQRTSQLPISSLNDAGRTPVTVQRNC